ncbi:DUF5979 domain-containing protein [Corynebacterium sp. CCM 8835]|uniref:SDR-like Ig domain-containing protein n=1 Tax=Corynebacterium antarcticum TaxID=2800405 RepID=A0ABS1FIK2_9CORY|nr:DUF5979 domain-containing protein [Corynebacterium antarcticum]MCK7643220.1 DUF5979 domain-containing protein [Corynebacterium antarcticum]MCL0246618.1 DUF5979 domain-containing protein [Corynebacterium antarcticum]MCX7541064.1 DUF5979 domain-containing protein [Corynebacterium antarcticum]
MNTRQLRGRPLPIVMLATLASVLALILAFISVPTAGAETGSDRTADYVTSVNFTRSSGKRASEPLRSDEALTLSIDFSAKEFQDDPDKAVQPGDYLVFELPGWLHTVSKAVNLTDASGDVVLECENADDDHAVRCVFTDFVTKNSQDVGGHYDMLVYGVANEEITPWSFDIGPATVSVTSILDEDVIGDGVLPPVKNPNQPEVIQENNSKTGNFVGVASWTENLGIIRWSIVVNGTGGALKIIDEMEGPQTPFERSNTYDFERKEGTDIRVRTRADEDASGGTWEYVAHGGNATPLPADDWTIDWDDSKATIGIPATEKGKVYQINIYTQFPMDAFPNGSRVSNTARIDGVDFDSTITAKAMVGGYAYGRPGYGKIALTKNVVSGVGTVPAGFKGPLAGDRYSVNLHWVDPDGTVHDEIVKVTEGQADLDSLPEFLKGTEVTVTEQAPADTENYTWAAPVFEKEGGDSRVTISDDKQQAVVVVGDNRVSSLAIRNTYAPKTASFSVTKQVEGLDEADVRDMVFEFTYTCGETTGMLDVRAGETVQSPEFPVGTVCTVVEDRGSAEFDGYSLTVSPESSTVVVAVDDSDDLKVTNTYDGPPPVVDGSGWASSAGIPWLIPLVGSAALASVALLPLLSSGGSVATQGSSNTGPAATPTVPGAPAPGTHVEQSPNNQTEQPKEERRGGLLAETGANVLLLVLVAFFLMGLGLVMVRRRRS